MTTTAAIHADDEGGHGMNAEEKRAYQRGYAAGKRRVEKIVNEEVQWERGSQFWREALLAAIPFAMTASWKRGGEAISTIESRVQLARSVADAALMQAESLGRL